MNRFTEGIETLITSLENGKSLEDLLQNCEALCGHSCTNDYMKGTCPKKAWLFFLAEAERENIIPSSVLTFLKYINFKHSKTLSGTITHLFLHFTVFFQLESVKSMIIDDLECGYSLNSIMKDYSSIGYDSMCRWLSILKRACDAGLIPNDDVLSFLTYI